MTRVRQRSLGINPIHRFLEAAKNVEVQASDAGRIIHDISAGQVTLVVNGTQGPDYTLLTTTNLAAGWQALFTTNSPAMPLTLVDTNSSDSARFYRVQLGP